MKARYVHRESIRNTFARPVNEKAIIIDGSQVDADCVLRPSRRNRRLCTIDVDGYWIVENWDTRPRSALGCELPTRP